MAMMFPSESTSQALFIPPKLRDAVDRLEARLVVVLEGDPAATQLFDDRDDVIHDERRSSVGRQRPLVRVDEDACAVRRLKSRPLFALKHHRQAQLARIERLRPCHILGRQHRCSSSKHDARSSRFARLGTELYRILRRPYVPQRPRSCLPRTGERALRDFTRVGDGRLPSPALGWSCHISDLGE